MAQNNAGQCLAICPLFEAELLLMLMLEKWGHPLADEETFRADLLEAATELLQVSSDQNCKEVFIDGMASQDMNFVSAIWYVEWNSIQDTQDNRPERELWLNKVRQTLPSCFCSTENLGP